jgi:hypothetical protein
MNNTQEGKWSENVILVDGDYVDKVAFNLIVNFERMLERRIPPADMARWIDCIALDGGLRTGEHHTQVVFLHSKGKVQLDNFVPAHFEKELNNQAFQDHLGEFVINSYPVEELVTAEDFFLDILRVIGTQKEVKRIMVVPDAEHIYNKVKDVLQRIDDEEKRITVFTMQPMAGGPFRQEILGYSLMNALGIKGSELKTEN